MMAENLPLHQTQSSLAEKIEQMIRGSQMDFMFLSSVLLLDRRQKHPTDNGKASKLPTRSITTLLSKCRLSVPIPRLMVIQFNGFGRLH